MTGVAEILHEKEIIFPEITALIISMWIVDKRVWRIEAGPMLSLMTLAPVPVFSWCFTPHFLWWST
jgi:membrane protein